MRPKPLKPVVRAWALTGCSSVAFGIIAMAFAVAAGPRDVASGIVYCVVFASATACLTIGPSLRQMQAPPPAPPDFVVQTSARAVVLLQFASLGALIGIAAAFVPGVLFRLGLLGLLTGGVWLVAAIVVRYREIHWFRGRLLSGKRASRFKPWTTSFYVVTSS